MPLTQAQQTEIEDLIKDADARDARGDKPGAAAKYQEAIDKVDDALGMPQPHPQYDPDERDAGITSSRTGKVTIGKAGFRNAHGPSAVWLAMIKAHEVLGHLPQLDPGSPTGWKGGNLVDSEEERGRKRADQEVEAWNAALAFAKLHGLGDYVIDIIKRMKKSYWNELDEPRKQGWKLKEPWLQSAALLPLPVNLAAELKRPWRMITPDVSRLVRTSRKDGNTKISAIAMTPLIVRDYEEALDYYCGVLGFKVLEDSAQEGKRWVRLRAPGGKGAELLLSKAANAKQSAAVGNQTGGRVLLFLHTKNLASDFKRLSSMGVEFEQPPAKMPYGKVAVFRDLYGNRIDLIQPKGR